ncbi:hypothetical protein B0A50_04224 [Salinomyces thailandicus]|uniref:MAPEG family protein n=1 Tax=Salinomyces thailandicus TaxID=706561 RepID=A0A4U0TWN6_9PEZI|nr:hypothetical protein B0A50_04224 [Salinomyces thailandica]
MAFGLGLVPHLFYTGRLMLASKGQMSIAHPRNNLENWKGKLPTAVWSQLSRARGAHLNSMEVFPLFAAAVVAGNVAKLPSQDLNDMGLSFLGARTLYMALYIGISNDVLAFARTGVYAWSIGIPLVALWRAGQNQVGRQE